MFTLATLYLSDQISELSHTAQVVAHRVKIETTTPQQVCQPQINATNQTAVAANADCGPPTGS